MSETKEDADDKVDVLLMYIRSDDERQYFADVTNLPNDGSPLPPQDDTGGNRQVAFTGGIVNPTPRPGQIFKFKMRDNSVFFEKKRTDPSRFVGRWRNESDVAQWCAQQNAWDAHAKAKKALAKDAAKKYHLEALDDLREAYRKLPSMQRPQLLAIVVRYLVA